MTTGPLLDKLSARIALDKDEGDIAYFHALSLHLEYLTKLVTACVIACIVDETDRHRYSLEHDIVRADSVGQWVRALNTALTGPPAQYFRQSASTITRDLTVRVGDGDWRYSAVSLLAQAARSFGIDPGLGPKVALRQLFDIGCSLRNRTRGHGAVTSRQCNTICPLLANALALLVGELRIFAIDWAHLHRNLSGKYRVSPLLGRCSAFNYLKSTRDEQFLNGTYIHLDAPIRVPLVFSDPELHDIFLPNGNYRANSFEVLSFITNDTTREDGSPWSDPPGRLPRSHTEGSSVLEAVGNTFANLPPTPVGRISRSGLETILFSELINNDRHPIITLTGPGGIGKTTLALAVIDALAKRPDTPYEVILWISSRDIDLLESGPKPVAPRVVRQQDIATAVVSLLEPSERHATGFQPLNYFEQCLTMGAAGTTLFVLDNFETLESPADVFNWIDTHIRLPNKVLITTRFRDFAGDYPIDIDGMTDDEAMQLIDQESRRLGISDLLSGAYREHLIDESDGHPYVIKILLGQVAAERRAVKPARIVASADHLLTALFERTYESLSPAAQRVLLLLCSWRVLVPAVAVEAICLRPGNERFNVAGALEELRRFSLVEEVASEVEGEHFVGVPLATASYGRRKLEVSPFKIAVEEDRKLLMEFGAGKREDARRGVFPRIERLIGTVALKASEDPSALDGFLPILEYIASRVPRTFISLADLIVEVGGDARSRERAIGYLRRFLEGAAPHERMEVWLRVAALCRELDDALGEVHALSEAALTPTATLEEIGKLAYRINSSIRDLKGRRVEDAWSPEVRLLITRVADAMERHRDDLSATDCSRLAWLYLNIKMEDRARDIAKVGLARDPSNEHCQNLVRKLEN